MEKNKIPDSTLSNGVEMPLLGLGVYDMYQKEAEEAVENALGIGYRLIDTAAMYENEKEIGAAIRNSGIRREDIFLTTKLNNTDHGFENTLKAFDESLKKLNQNYVDLYLIHWPVKGKRKESWRALEKLYNEKRVRAIGVANYTIPFLEELNAYCTIMPAVNQIEFSPWLYQKELLDYCRGQKIQLQSYSPITRGIKFNDARLRSLCEKYQKTPAQIVLNWHMQQGVSTIPKSSKKDRLIENYHSVSFALEPADSILMNGFHENFRICDDPIQFL